MLELVADNSLLRMLLLLMLFASVAVGAFLVTQSFADRQATRRRLVEGDGGGGSAIPVGSLRTDRVESSWLKLVNAIEKRGLSLVDSKDAALRQKLIAAG